VGALAGEPERDVWVVETELGICELHRLRAGAPAEEESPADRGDDEWVLARWED
jgi:hypothetical protein